MSQQAFLPYFVNMYSIARAYRNGEVVDAQSADTHKMVFCEIQSQARTLG